LNSCACPRKEKGDELVSSLLLLTLLLLLLLTQQEGCRRTGMDFSKN